MLCSGGVCDSAIAAKCCVAWEKFRKLLPVLTSRHLSARIHYERSLSYAPCMVAKFGDQRNPSLGSSTAMSVPWSVGSVASKTETKHPQLHITTETWHQGHHISPLLLATRMVWPCTTSHVLYQITNFQISSTRKKGRPRKTWSVCVKTDVNKCGLAGVDALDRDAWRACVQHSLVLPTPWNGTWTAH